MTASMEPTVTAEMCQTERRRSSDCCKHLGTRCLKLKSCCEGNRVEDHAHCNSQQSSAIWFMT